MALEGGDASISWDLTCITTRLFKDFPLSLFYMLSDRNLLYTPNALEAASISFCLFPPNLYLSAFSL